MIMDGVGMFRLAERLFPINRSLTGEGVRESMRILQEYMPELEVHEVPSGTQAFDWVVPDEWNVREAYIEDSSGNKIVDFMENNLHVVGYSAPIDKWVTKEELLQYIYVDEVRENAIPYVTSYYQQRSGFCMSKRQRDGLADGSYHMVIDSTLGEGFMTYGEIVIPSNISGGRAKEVFFSTYICHPSMANNELSGPCLMTSLVREIKRIEKRRYTYRFLIAPETIGAIYYISKNLIDMKRNIVAGYVLSCVGDDRTFSYVPSRQGDTLADRIALNTLQFSNKKYIQYSFLDRASDERQYCSPGVDLPVCVVCRSKYGCYPEYHTSDDNLAVISEKGLGESKDFYMQMVQALEYNQFYQTFFYVNHS